jgi:hypothetical protein
MTASVVKDGNSAIALAKNAIASSDRNLRLAAQYLGFAEETGKTQRQMAEGVGKSVGWVNRLLKWRRDGFPGDTPFGPQSAEARERKQEHVQSPEQPEPEDLEERRKQRERNRHHKERQREREFEEEVRARMAEAQHRASQIGESDRRRLVGVLGLLGSDKPGEVLAAASKAEAIRRSLNLSWDDLIVLAVVDEAIAA